MELDIGIFMGALGIVTLTFSEASAVGLAVYAESRRPIAFAYTAAGILVVIIPTLVVGSLLSLLPHFVILAVGGVLLLYFGIRLLRSARRSVLKGRTGGTHAEQFEKGLMYTAFSVGVVEAFESAIVMVALLPTSYDSAVIGLVTGAVLVIVAVYVLRSQVVKIRQAIMKIVLSGLLLSFSVFWFSEIVTDVPEFLEIPLFVFFALVAYWIANRPSPPVPFPPASTAPAKPN